MKLVKMSKVHL